MKRGDSRTAVWALTPRGTVLAATLQAGLPRSRRFLPDGADADDDSDITRFDRLSTAVSREFGAFDSHVFIMSAGIVVRVIASLITHKLKDPAVVVVDEAGRFAISLLSGHVGGANALARSVAAVIGAEPVITTATDVNGLPGIDFTAAERGLFIETPGAIKFIHMAILKGEDIRLHDPYDFLTGSDFAAHGGVRKIRFDPKMTPVESNPSVSSPLVFVDDVLIDSSPHVLVLRPPTLFIGIGCNRNTSVEEMKNLLLEVMVVNRLSPASLAGIASIDLKRDEPGILELGRDLSLPLYFYSKEELNAAGGIESPSAVVQKHVGVTNVCEAAALTASRNGTLIVPKKKSRNATVAVARIGCISSESDRETFPTCRDAPLRS